MRCGYRDDIARWLANVGGSLDLDTIPWPHVPIPDPGPLVPLLAGPMGTLPAWPAYGVRWSWLLSDAQQPAVPGGSAIRPAWTAGRRPADVAGAPAGAVMVAAMVGPDGPIERYWTCHRASEEDLARAGFDIVIGPNYSVYGDHPRVEHRLNIKRSFLAAAWLRERGVPAVPHVYVWRITDIDAVARFVRERGVDVLAVNLQTFRQGGDHDAAIARYVALRDAVPHDLRWMVVGPSSPGRVREALSVFGRCTILTGRPVQLALHGRRLLPDGRDAPHPARPADLLAENLRVMREWIERG